MKRPKNDVIWAPWRMGFILESGKKGCFLCELAKNGGEYVLFTGKNAFVTMNIYPYNNGHLMIAPLKHKRSLTLLENEESAEIFFLIAESVKILDKVMKPRGFNVGANFGRCAGAGVPGHIHFHVVPRWSGDTNFMTTVAGVKIIPQALAELHGILKPEFDGMGTR